MNQEAKKAITYNCSHFSVFIMTIHWRISEKKSYWLIQAGCLITIPFTKTFVERYRKIFVMIPFGYRFTDN